MSRLIGGNPFEVYLEGRLEGIHKYPMLCIYPLLDLVVTGSGTHANCHFSFVERAKEYGFDPSDQERWLEEYVAGIARGGDILVRADKHSEEHVSRAIVILETLFPERVANILHFDPD